MLGYGDTIPNASMHVHHFIGKAFFVNNFVKKHPFVIEALLCLFGFL